MSKTQSVHFKLELDISDLLDRYNEELVDLTYNKLQEIYGDIPDIMDRVHHEARMNIVPGNKLVVPVTLEIVRQ